jgi:peptidoglycan hydrolase-like protein with peptidoglycan-binding domain
MQPIGFPLKQKMQDRSVADLHVALALLEIPIAEKEKTAQRYGASTQLAVRQFQAERQLPTTNGVDEATARAINASLAERGALDGQGDRDTSPSWPVLFESKRDVPRRYSAYPTRRSAPQRTLVRQGSAEVAAARRGS